MREHDTQLQFLFVYLCSRVSDQFFFFHRLPFFHPDAYPLFFQQSSFFFHRFVFEINIGRTFFFRTFKTYPSINRLWKQCQKRKILSQVVRNRGQNERRLDSQNECYGEVNVLFIVSSRVGISPSMAFQRIKDELGIRRELQVNYQDFISRELKIMFTI